MTTGGEEALDTDVCELGGLGELDGLGEKEAEAEAGVGGVNGLVCACRAGEAGGVPCIAGGGCSCIAGGVGDM